MNKTEKLEFTFSHMGINSENVEEAKNMSIFLSAMFGLQEAEGNESIFLDREIEVIKSKGLGRCGHIAFYTPDIKKAMKYLEAKGNTFNMDSAKYNESGDIVIIYLNQEINGFAIHLTSKRKK